MRKIYLIILLILSSFNFLAAQDSYTIKGKIIYKETDEPLFAVNVFANRDSVIAGTVTDLDGTFELKLDYKPKTINVEYIGLASKEIETNFNDKNEMILNTFLEEIKFELNWEKESVEYNHELTGKWIVKKMTSNNNKRGKLPKKFKNRYFFIFDAEEYDSLKYGELTFSEGCRGTVKSYYRFTNTDELELRPSNILTEIILLGCRYKKKKHAKLYYEYRSIWASMTDNIVNYKLDNGKLYIWSENSQFILEKSIKPTG